jgi:hypothetical protein
MDGLSAASSGIAVVSLAIQLVDSVREIRRFFRTLKDAPEELGRLLDLLEHMELILENIGKLVDPDSDLSPSVLKAIQTCEKALNKLGALIQKVKRNSLAQIPLKRSLGFFRLACKKQEVEEIEKQLDRAVGNLNMVMTYFYLNFRPSTLLKLNQGPQFTWNATALERGISNQHCDSYNHRGGSPYGSCCQPKRFEAKTDRRQLESALQVCSLSTFCYPQGSLSGFLGQHHCQNSIPIRGFCRRRTFKRVLC